MDKKGALEKAARFANAVEAVYKDARIYLFGSYLSGRYKTESDIDIAVILENYQNISDIQLELMRLRRKIDSRIEPHPFRKEDFNADNPLAFEVLKHGLEIKPANS